jgi:RNA-directed DNA polymerase
MTGLGGLKPSLLAGCSLTEVISDLNPTLRGWIEYFKHGQGSMFSRLDGWIRRRLRSILRKQQKRPGIARSSGADHTRWPNAFFEGYGLISLQATRVAARQSSRR